MQLKLNNQIPLGNCDFLGFSTAQKNIMRSLELQGVDITANTDKTLAHIGAHMFVADNGKTNYLWHPHEANAINPGLIAKMNGADYLIASCKHNKDVFLEAGATKPISVCKLGIDTDVFKPRPNAPKSKKFRFLWLGNPIDMRKGWDIASKAFLDEFKPDESVELYLKTTGKEIQDLATLGPNVIFDSRNIALADLLDLYESSHVFVCSSRGEASNLPALEAMAMKLLVLCPPVMGMKDFIKYNNSIALQYEMIPGNYGIDITVPQVLVDDLRHKMREVYENYLTYKQMRNNARKYVQKHHSLRSMGRRLVDIIFNNN